MPKKRSQIEPFKGRWYGMRLDKVVGRGSQRFWAAQVSAGLEIRPLDTFFNEKMSEIFNQDLFSEKEISTCI